MNAVDASKVRAQLAQVLVGATIVSIDRPDPGKSECLFKVVADKGRHTYECHVHATDLGWWVSGAKERLKMGGPVAFTNVQDVFEEMVDLLTGEKFDDFDFESQGHKVFTTLEDPRLRTVGFRCTVTNQEWHLTLGALKASPWKHEFSTPESRAALAAHIGQHLKPPPPKEQAA